MYLIIATCLALFLAALGGQYLFTYLVNQKNCSPQRANRHVIKLFLLLVVVIVSSSNFSNNKGKNHQTTESQLGWPDGAHELVAHLNSWDKQRLSDAARGKGDKETTEWVDVHIIKLRDTGSTCTWSPGANAYVLSDPQPSRATK